MKILTIVDEDFINYKNPCMYIAMPHCSFKCGECTCQNNHFKDSEIKDVDIEYLIIRYMNNKLTSSVVFSGLEPFDSFYDMKDFIIGLRSRCNDDVVIYTGYEESEIKDKLDELKIFGNIIVKFGRFIENSNPRYDELLGVELASENQYAKRL